MSEAKHTPGPWKADVHPESDKADAVFAGEPRRKVAYCQPLFGRWHVQETEANARLIAAAPDLYEALAAFDMKEEDLVGAQGGELIVRVRTKWLAQASAALAKARGE